MSEHTQSRIRRATPEDAAAIAQVHVAAWGETYAAIVPEGLLAALSIEKREAIWRDMLTDFAAFQLRAVLVAELDGSIVGFGACGWQRDAGLAAKGFDGEVGSIYLRRYAQGYGLGAALLHRMFDELRGAGFDAVSLWVLTNNMAARGFYERFGGRVVGEKDDVRGETTLHELAYGWTTLDWAR